MSARPVFVVAGIGNGSGEFAQFCEVSIDVLNVFYILQALALPPRTFLLVEHHVETGSSL